MTATSSLGDDTGISLWTTAVICDRSVGNSLPTGTASPSTSAPCAILGTTVAQLHPT
jgi:hypothetical protein